MNYAVIVRLSYACAGGLLAAAVYDVSIHAAGMPENMLHIATQMFIALSVAIFLGLKLGR